MKLKGSAQIKTATTKKLKYKLNAKNIINYLEREGVDIKSVDEAVIEFHVPGGGDWSNTSIDISDDDPIHVSLTCMEIKHG